jgi:hypothetical protein
MLSRIDNSEVFLRFMKAYRAHNAQCPSYTTSRTCKTTGRVTEFCRQRGVISESVKTTFYIILRKYVESYVAAAASMSAGLHSDASPPPLYTNSVFLSIECDCSDRTIRNHLRQLRNLGVVRTKFRGRKHDYELWISPEFLYGGEGEAMKQSADFGRKNDFSSLNSKIFPVNNIHREVFEKEKGSADMFINHGESNDGERGRTENSLLGSEEPVEQTEREQTGGAGAPTRELLRATATELRLKNAERALEGRLLKGPRGLDPRLFNLIWEFWLYAWKVVYPGKSFTKEQQEKALVAIMKGVYNNFEDKRTEREWIDFQVFQFSKLDKAHKYYDHHPEQWAPDPYSVAVAGKGYFDRENKHGFAVIEGWIAAELRQKSINKFDRGERDRRKEEICTEILRKARVDIENERAGRPLRKETKGKSLLGIYRHYHAMLRKMGNKYSDQLDRQYNDQQARDFAPPKYNQAKRIRKNLVKLNPDPTPATVMYIDPLMEDDGEGYYLPA